MNVFSYLVKQKLFPARSEYTSETATPSDSLVVPPDVEFSWLLVLEWVWVKQPKGKYVCLGSCLCIAARMQHNWSIQNVQSNEEVSFTAAVLFD